MSKKDKEVLNEVNEVQSEEVQVVEETKLMSEAEIDNIAKETGAALKKEEKVKIKIPVDQLNKNDDSVPVVINGYIYQIKRGERVEVPEVVANILEEAGYI